MKTKVRAGKVVANSDWWRLVWLLTSCTTALPKLDFFLRTIVWAGAICTLYFRLTCVKGDLACLSNRIIHTFDLARRLLTCVSLTAGVHWSSKLLKLLKCERQLPFFAGAHDLQIGTPYYLDKVTSGEVDEWKSDVMTVRELLERVTTAQGSLAAARNSSLATRASSTSSTSPAQQVPVLCNYIRNNTTLQSNRGPLASGESLHLLAELLYSVKPDKLLCSDDTCHIVLLGNLTNLTIDLIFRPTQLYVTSN